MRGTVVAIIGRPNVGKSSFFNFVAKTRISIVDDEPGVTRDRIYTSLEWQGNRFTLIDTGGIEPNSDRPLLQQMRLQAEMAVEMADVILLMVDLKAGLTAADQDIANMLRKSGKKIVVAVNKCDQLGLLPEAGYEFYNLGLGELYPISSAHGLGIGDILDALTELLPDLDIENDDEDEIKVAIIGKPNAGKSSLFNRLSGEERAIVSDIAGTTRDALDSVVANEFGKYRFIDTAGLRRKSRIRDHIERYSIIRAVAAVERAEVCLILLDANEGVTEQDTKVAGMAHNSGKASIFVVNKWDLIDKTEHDIEEFINQIRVRMAFMSYAPIIFISALTGQRCMKIYPQINAVYAEATKRIATGGFNDFIAEVQAMVPAPQYKGRRLKISYATQVAVMPPEFILFVNSTELLHFSYDRYLENQVRKRYGFEGTPIRLTLREKGGREKISDKIRAEQAKKDKRGSKKRDYETK